ncbi:MAG: hypothetical protein IJW97_06150 [Clostridia bacterium]|nr:hypothetical protein [Clostridia bacterium]
MKTKLLSLTLVLMLLLSAVSLWGCEKELTEPYDLMEAAAAKTEALESIHAEMTTDIKMKITGISTETSTKMDVKAANLHGDNPVASIDMEMSMLGMTVEMQVYTDKDYAYIDMGELGRYKSPVGEATEDYDAMGDMADMLKVIPEELLEGIEAVENDQGIKTISLALTAEQFRALFADLVDEMVLSLAGEEDDGTFDLTLSDCYVEATIAPNGYFDSYRLKYGMDLTVAGMKSTAQVDTYIKYISPGESVTVTPPEGYESFPEMDESLLG